MTLAIYNILGQKVRTLIDAFRPAGTYKVVWDGLDNLGNVLPTGIYITQFKGSDFQLNRKMMLIK